MEVITFEVKPADAITVTAVYEALAYLRSATHADVIFHVPDDAAESVQQVIEEARRVSRTHGVGLITMADPRAWDTWNELDKFSRGFAEAGAGDVVVDVLVDGAQGLAEGRGRLDLIGGQQ